MLIFLHRFPRIKCHYQDTTPCSPCSASHSSYSSANSSQTLLSAYSPSSPCTRQPTSQSNCTPARAWTSQPPTQTKWVWNHPSHTCTTAPYSCAVPASYLFCAANPTASSPRHSAPKSGSLRWHSVSAYFSRTSLTYHYCYSSNRPRRHSLRLPFSWCWRYRCLGAGYYFGWCRSSRWDPLKSQINKYYLLQNISMDFVYWTVQK